jgi:hypothetical protein
MLIYLKVRWNEMDKEKIINKLKYISNNPLINGEYDEENYLFDDEAKLLLNYIKNWNKIKDYIEIKRDEYSNEDNEWWFINRFLKYMEELEKEVS